MYHRSYIAISAILYYAILQIARDLEAIYKEGRLADFTIVASGRELPAHQIILSARSPVFAAMLEPHTEEAKNSRVVFPDIDFEVCSFFVPLACNSTY